ncbi:MAG: cellulase family glycosylhydrolase [Polyangiaceae bacterium]|nr:cellulase family glycosylhydrolase [Polyangiaceae bacterium]
MSERRFGLRGVRRSWGGLVGVMAMVAVGCGEETPSVARGGAAADPPLRAVAVPGGIGHFEDAEGREVLLRGVNVNTYAEYWQFDPALPATLAFTEADMDYLAGLGYDVVRLLITWSRVEPSPGEYDAAYLATVAEVIDGLWARGIYTLVDMHQDAWGPSLAARPGEACTGSQRPAPGWDGAPAWATLVAEATPRCTPLVAGRHVRELSPAVVEAWASFFANAAGPGGVGLHERFAAMWGEVARVLGGRPGTMGYDVLNEPNAFALEQFPPLAEIYGKALAAIRAGEASAGTEPRVFLFEPSGNWANVLYGSTVERFTEDPQVAYAPHVYQGTIGLMPLDERQLERLREEVVGFGGVPVLVSEWGAGPESAGTANDPFALMVAAQDANHWSMAHWVYQAACGDPHNYGNFFDGTLDQVSSWAYRRVSCATPTTAGEPYAAMIAVLARPAVHAAPGRIDAIAWDPATGSLTASGATARSGQEAILYLPAAHADLTVTWTGATEARREAHYGGQRIVARADGGAWSVATAR